MTQALNQAYQLTWLTAEDLRQAGSILFQCYRDDPLFMALFDAKHPDYEKRLRSSIRDELQHLWQGQHRLLGCFEGSSLLGLACLVSEPQGTHKLWSWRLSMLLTAGLGTTQQWLTLEKRLVDEIGLARFDWLAFVAVSPAYRQQGLGQMLIEGASKAARQAGQGCLALLLSRPQEGGFFLNQGFVPQSPLTLGELEVALWRKDL
ncbi:GNAT family N-acetyltransferase [Gallaecimonas xiamenensis]|uniref:N-acetyltransferase GCN5 n=1 Tax=Gallaecimonas xiamenensis 3-C-1 TaxID=745411 RepID=K2JUJ9_9GAMM|nr:GNAT family N-acetyltransferase [Gallaecimonas xiamenensis]EKE74054.1 N-acetyltransferase GCN5 [Gallaecimonas xiamenensis 3-C-1]